jgi:hypothetical protein
MDDVGAVLAVEAGTYNKVIREPSIYLPDDVDLAVERLRVSRVDSVKAKSGAVAVVAVFRDPIFEGDDLSFRFGFIDSKNKERSFLRRPIKISGGTLQFFAAERVTARLPGAISVQLIKNKKTIATGSIAVQ